MKDECNYLWGSKAPKLAIGIAGHNPAAIRQPARPRKSPAQVNPGAMVKRGGHSQKKVTCAKTEKSKITIMTIHDIHIVFFSIWKQNQHATKNKNRPLTPQNLIFRQSNHGIDLIITCNNHQGWTYYLNMLGINPLKIVVLPPRMENNGGTHHEKLWSR